MISTKPTSPNQFLKVLVWRAASSSSATSKEADFRQAVNYRFDPWQNQIRKAKFSSPEVLVLLEGFDIEVD